MPERRVLRLLTRLNIGGPSRHALILARDLAERYPTVLAAGTPSPDEGELADAAVPVRRVPFVRPLRPPTDVRALIAVRGLLKEIEPAIMHTHMAKAGAIGRAAALTLSSERPLLVHTFHGHVLDGYFSDAVARGFLAVERALARRTDVLVAVSGEIRDQLLALGIGREEQWRTIPLGLDLQDLLRADGHSGVLRDELKIGDSPLAGMVGRLVPIKDVGTAIRAIARIDGVHLAVVGDGESRSALRALTSQLRVENRVHFVGWRHDIAGVMADLDLALLTSRNEGTPVALIEAAAAGKPAVATDVGGVRTVVIQGQTGWLVPSGDVTTIAETIEGALRHPDLLAVMGAAARRHASTHFSAPRLVRDVAALYDELLKA